MKTNMKKLLYTIIIYAAAMFGAVTIFGQEINPPTSSPKESILDLAYDNILVLLAIIVLVGVILAGLNLVWALIDLQRMKLLEKYGTEVMEKANLSTSSSLWEKISQKSWNLVPLEKEKEIEMSHEYDGIRELDNSLPPWWVYLFYITIIWSVIYLYYYHVSDSSLNQEQEYIAAMEMAEADKSKYLANKADDIDEKTVTLLSGESELGEGKEIYITSCAVCHGNSGEGLVGPNFVDKYWVHGGSVNDLFKVIKNGVPEKGMISWQSQLRPAAMQKVASYILSLQGTNPPNQKAQEGELYEGNIDATAIVQDSTTIK